MQFVVLINCSSSWLLSAFLALGGPPLHLFMCTHAQKVSFYLTSYPLASPFSWPTIWPPPHPLVISLCCLTLIWTLVFLSLPVLCLSHTNTPADVVGNAKPLKGSHKGGREPGAGKSHDRSPGSGNTKTHLSQLLSVPSCQQSPPPTAYSPFSTWDQTFKRAKLWFRPHFAVSSESGGVAQHKSVPTMVFWRPWCQKCLRSLIHLITVQI